MPRTVNSGPRLIRTKHPRTPFCVVYVDPAKREKSGRSKRIPKWFSDEVLAQDYLKDIQRKLHQVGTVGLAMDEATRADYWAARQRLNAAGFSHVPLRQLAEKFIAATPAPAKSRLLLTALSDCIAFKLDVEGASQETTDNIEDRLKQWWKRDHLTHVDELTEEAIKELRSRAGAGATTRKNDMAAASTFCSYLVQETKELLVNPVKGMRRPRIPAKPPAIWQNDQVRLLLDGFAAYAKGRYLPAIVLMLANLRPSEVPFAKIIYTGKPCIRLEGDAGKLRGRANRIVPLWPAAVAWLKLAGSPQLSIRPLNNMGRQRVCRRLGLKWAEDICRHTSISNRAAMIHDEGKVAREAGTSPGVIFAKYHRVRTVAEARAFYAIAPGKR